MDTARPPTPTAWLTVWPVPLIVTIGLGVALPLVSQGLALGAARLLRFNLEAGFNLPYLYTQHGFQLALALLGIAFFRRVVPADYGLHWPRGRSYIAASVIWGIVFGVVMTVIGFAPEWLSGTAPQLDYPLTAGNITAWLGFEGLYVGPTEEIPFRALMVTYLAATMPGQRAQLRLNRLGTYNMNKAGLIVALIFALAHANSFLTSAWPLALAQQVYAFVFGVLYAYWLEKSGSVLAPIIGHNVGDGVAYGLMFLWVGLAR